MKNLHYLIGLTLAGSMTFTSCGGGDEKVDGPEDGMDTTAKVETVNTPVSETFFQVLYPSPHTSDILKE